MLSEKAKSVMVEVCKKIAENHNAFAQAYAVCLVELGANDWRDKDYLDLFRRIKKELRPLVVETKILGEGVFSKLCKAAELSLLFDLPFSLSMSCKKGDYHAIAEKIKADKTDDDPPVKFRRALAEVRAENRPQVEKGGKALPLPAPDDTAESYGKRLCQALLEHCEQEGVKELCKSPEVAKIVTLAELMCFEAKQVA